MTFDYWLDLWQARVGQAVTKGSAVDGPGKSLRATMTAIRSLDTVLAEQVRECKRRGMSWQEIARITEVSKPTAIKRWSINEGNDVQTTTTPPRWTLQPGDTISRKQLHNIFGGNRQGGIAPCRNADEVLLFSGDGAQHDYIDSPMPDGTFHYTGEGQEGDQELTRGNRAIAEHAADDKRLRLFEGARGVVTYLGEYEHVDHSYKQVVRPDGTTRKVIRFVLRPV